MKLSSWFGHIITCVPHDLFSIIDMMYPKMFLPIFSKTVHQIDLIQHIFRRLGALATSYTPPLKGVFDAVTTLNYSIRSFFISPKCFRATSIKTDEINLNQTPNWYRQKIYISEKRITQETLHRKFFAFLSNVRENILTQSFLRYFSFAYI